MLRFIKVCLLVCSLALGSSALVVAAESAPAASKTLENLQAAFNGESNAHNRYLEFAKKADEEGYGQVASLFRAASAAEKVHLENHAKVIVEMGALPKATIVSPEVKSTKENLEAAIKGETYERDVMYPEFIAEAKQSGNKQALRSFVFAKTVEAQHADLYQGALDNLEAWKGGSKDFYVCPVCGNTVTAVSLANCPICDTPKEQFVVVK